MGEKATQHCYLRVVATEEMIMIFFLQVAQIRSFHRSSFSSTCKLALLLEIFFHNIVLEPKALSQKGSSRLSSVVEFNRCCRRKLLMVCGLRLVKNVPA